MLITLAFAVGVPLLDEALPNPDDIGGGTVLEVDRGVSFEAQGGWHLDKSATEAIPATVLSRDGDTFTVAVLAYEDARDKGWFDESGDEGRGRISYAERISFATDSGLSGETYYFHGQDLAGRAWVIGLEDQGTAIRAILQSTPAHFDDVYPDAEMMAESISLSADRS